MLRSSDGLRVRVAAAVAVATLLATSGPTGAAEAADFSDLTWSQQDQWVLDHLMTPGDATRFVGVGGVTMTDGGNDRICSAAPDEGVKCSDVWGGGSWLDNYLGPAIALPRGVSVTWYGQPEDAQRELGLLRGGYGVMEESPTRVSGFNDYGGKNPVGWSDAVSGGWFVSAFCTPAFGSSQQGGSKEFLAVPSVDVVDCAQRLAREQFTKLGIDQLQVTAPASPTGVLLAVKGPSATVTWIAPDSDGGMPVTRYVATSGDGTLTCTAAPKSALVQSCAAPGAKPGVAYTFTVVAFNEVGASGPSQPSSSGQYLTRASVPRAVAAKLTGTNASVTWQRPSVLGGLPVLRYEVTATPGSLRCTTKALTCTIAGLNYATRYRFQVRAINGRGSSTGAWTKWSRTSAAPRPVAPSPAPTPVKPVAPIS